MWSLSYADKSQECGWSRVDSSVEACYLSPFLPLPILCTNKSTKGSVWQGKCAELASCVCACVHVLWVLFESQCWSLQHFLSSSIFCYTFSILLLAITSPLSCVSVISYFCVHWCGERQWILWMESKKMWWQWQKCVWVCAWVGVFVQVYHVVKVWASQDSSDSGGVINL